MKLPAYPDQKSRPDQREHHSERVERCCFEEKVSAQLARHSTRLAALTRKEGHLAEGEHDCANDRERESCDEAKGPDGASVTRSPAY